MVNRFYLTRFEGYDAIVVTWTSAEAAALAAMFTPDYLPSQWYEYRHDVASYIPLVTGGRRGRVARPNRITRRGRESSAPNLFLSET